VAVSEGVGRERLGAAGSTVIVSPLLSVDVVAMRTIFGLPLGMVGSAVRLLADGVEPKESIACRRGMAVLDMGRSVGEARRDEDQERVLRRVYAGNGWCYNMLESYRALQNWTNNTRE
jgi:hypothetical protein